MKQLIICVETSKIAATDVLYIDKTIKTFYKIDNSIKLSYVYCEGKTKYNSKSIISEIKDKKAKIKDSVVIYAFDTDAIDSNATDIKLTSLIESYCYENNYSFIWFYRDIEEVFLHQSIDNTKKVSEAKKFSNLSNLAKADEKSLSFNDKVRYKSNILIVLDKYLARR